MRFDSENYSIKALREDAYVFIASTDDGRRIQWGPDQVNRTLHTKADLVEIRDLINAIIEPKEFTV